MDETTNELEPASFEVEEQMPDAGEWEDVKDRDVAAPAELRVDSRPVRLTKNDAAADQCAAGAEPVMRPSAAVKTPGVRTGLLRRLLHYSLPLSLLVVILLGGLYLLCDLWNETLGDLGLLISPQLKHVRGAPPV